MTLAARIRPLNLPALRDRPTAASGILRPRQPFGLPAGHATAPPNSATERASPLRARLKSSVDIAIPCEPSGHQPDA